MKVIVLYRPNSEHSRQVDEFVHDFLRVEPSRSVDIVDVDSPDGVAKCELYDIVEYPSVIALNNAGAMLKSWSGSLPLMDELSYYAQKD